MKSNKHLSLEEHSKISVLQSSGESVRSTITYPYLTTHRQLSEEQKIACGVSDDFMRFSVGLEDVDDIIEDLDRAIKIALDV